MGMFRETISFFGESRALTSVRARLSPERREYITSIERDAFPAGGRGTLHSRRRNVKRQPDVMSGSSAFFSQKILTVLDEARTVRVFRDRSRPDAYSCCCADAGKYISFFGESRALRSVRARLSPERGEYITSIERFIAF